MSDKIPLDPNRLTLEDMERAEEALPMDPLDILASGKRMAVARVVGWCFRTRDDPEFTWADAHKLTLGDFELGDSDQPPPIASPGEPGTSDAPPEPKPSKTRPPKPEPNSSSASSSA